MKSGEFKNNKKAKPLSSMFDKLANGGGSWFGGSFGEVPESEFNPEPKAEPKNPFYGTQPPEKDDTFVPVPEPGKAFTPQGKASSYIPDEQFFKDIASDEGEVLSLYKDDKGNDTIGIGHLVTPEEKASGKIYGIDYKNGLTSEQAQEIKKQDVQKHINVVKKLTPNFDELPQNVQNNLLNATFHGTWSGSPNARKLFAEGKYEEAANEFLNNKSYQDRKAKGTGGTYTKRMERTAEAIRSMANQPTQTGEPAPVAEGKATPAEMPEDRRQGIEDRLQGFKATYENQLEDFKKDAASLDSELLSELGKAQQIYQASSDRIASRELWDTIITGLGHLAAGLIGNQTGLNLGGIKFDKTDWDTKRSLLLSELKNSEDKAFQKMNSGQRNLAERRAAAYQDYQVGARDIDRALQQLRHDEDLAWKREKAVNDKIEDLRRIEVSADKERKSQIKALMSSARTDMGRALHNLNKKSDEENLNAVALEAIRYNKQAEALGLPPLYPDPEQLTADVPGRVWGTNIADYEAVNKRLQEFYKGQGTQAEQPGVKYVTLSNGKRVPVKDK